MGRKGKSLLCDPRSELPNYLVGRSEKRRAKITNGMEKNRTAQQGLHSEDAHLASNGVYRFLPPFRQGFIWPNVLGWLALRAVSFRSSGSDRKPKFCAFRDEVFRADIRQ